MGIFNSDDLTDITCLCKPDKLDYLCSGDLFGNIIITEFPTMTPK